MQYHEFRAMNTSILLAGDGPVASVQTGFSLTQKYIEECEKRFTRFSEASELSSLNRSSGEWFEASQDLFDVVALAMRLHRQTEGLFDPSILEALEAAGYDRSMDELRLYGSAASPVLVRPRLFRFGEMRLDAERCRIYLPVGMRIDLGGIAKGWIAEKAAKVLADWTQVCAVDAGGDAFMVGYPPGEDAWRVTLEDPTEPVRGLAVLKIPPGGVATSTVTKRRWKQGDLEQHHLIDPRTQHPAKTEWLSMTVIAPHTAEAEVYAKSLLIGGSTEINRILSLEPGVEFVAVDHRKKLWGSPHSRPLIQV